MLFHPLLLLTWPPNATSSSHAVCPASRAVSPAVSADRVSGIPRVLCYTELDCTLRFRCRLLIRLHFRREEGSHDPFPDPRHGATLCAETSGTRHCRDSRAAKHLRQQSHRGRSPLQGYHVLVLARGWRVVFQSGVQPSPKRSAPRLPTSMMVASGHRCHPPYLWVVSFGE